MSTSEFSQLITDTAEKVAKELGPPPPVQPNIKVQMVKHIASVALLDSQGAILAEVPVQFVDLHARSSNAGSVELNLHVSFRACY